MNKIRIMLTIRLLKNCKINVKVNFPTRCFGFKLPSGEQNNFKFDMI